MTGRTIQLGVRAGVDKAWQVRVTSRAGWPNTFRSGRDRHDFLLAMNRLWNAASISR